MTERTTKRREPSRSASDGLPPRTPGDLMRSRRQPPRRGALAHLFLGLGLVLARPRVWGSLVLYSILTALPVSLLVHASAMKNVAPIAQAPGEERAIDFLHGAPDWLMAEWRRNDPQLIADAGLVLAPLMLLASLFGLLVSAGWMHMAVRAQREHSLMAFARGAGGHFLPFLRTWILGLGLFWFVSWLVWGLPGEALMKLLLPMGNPDLATSESWARNVENGRVLLYAVLLLEVELILDLARASLVVSGRRSALGALGRGTRFHVQKPWRVLFLVLVGFGLEMLWIFGTVTLIDVLAWPLWLLVLLVPFGRIVLRGGRHAGLATLRLEEVRLSGEPLNLSPFDDGTAWRTSSDSDLAQA